MFNLHTWQLYRQSIISTKILYCALRPFSFNVNLKKRNINKLWTASRQIKYTKTNFVLRWVMCRVTCNYTMYI